MMEALMLNLPTTGRVRTSQTSVDNWSIRKSTCQYGFHVQVATAAQSPSTRLPGYGQTPPSYFRPGSTLYSPSVRAAQGDVPLGDTWAWKMGCVGTVQLRSSPLRASKDGGSTRSSRGSAHRPDSLTRSKSPHPSRRNHKEMHVKTGTVHNL